MRKGDLNLRGKEDITSFRPLTAELSQGLLSHGGRTGGSLCVSVPHAEVLVELKWVYLAIIFFLWLEISFVLFSP